MKAILEFDLPDDADDFKDATRGRKYAACLVELWNEFRANYKYSEEQNTTWTDARQLLLDVFAANNINIDDL